MSRLPQLERAIVEVARRQEEHETADRRSRPLFVRIRPRPTRVLALAVVSALAVAAAALAATGVIGPTTTTRPGPPAVSLPPGVVTVLESRTPNGLPLRLTLQRIQFEGHSYLCLGTNVRLRSGQAGHSIGTQTSSECPSLPFVQAPVVLTSAAWCSPRPARIIWGLVLDPSVTVVLTTPSGAQRPLEVPVPPTVRIRGHVFYSFADAAPLRLTILRGSATVESQLLAAQGTAGTCAAGTTPPRAPSSPPTR
jgi:hypothetical protein